MRIRPRAELDQRSAYVHTIHVYTYIKCEYRYRYQNRIVLYVRYSHRNIYTYTHNNIYIKTVHEYVYTIIYTIRYIACYTCILFTSSYVSAFDKVSVSSTIRHADGKGDLNPFSSILFNSILVTVSKLKLCVG